MLICVRKVFSLAGRDQLASASDTEKLFYGSRVERTWYRMKVLLEVKWGEATKEQRGREPEKALSLFFRYKNTYQMSTCYNLELVTKVSLHLIFHILGSVFHCPSPQRMTVSRQQCALWSLNSWWNKAIPLPSLYAGLEMSPTKWGMFTETKTMSSDKEHITSSLPTSHWKQEHQLIQDPKVFWITREFNGFVMGKVDPFIFLHLKGEFHKKSLHFMKYSFLTC